MEFRFMSKYIIRPNWCLSNFPWISFMFFNLYFECRQFDIQIQPAWLQTQPIQSGQYTEVLGKEVSYVHKRSALEVASFNCSSALRRTCMISCWSTTLNKHRRWFMQVNLMKKHYYHSIIIKKRKKKKEIKWQQACECQKKLFTNVWQKFHDIRVTNFYHLKFTDGKPLLAYHVSIE